MGYSGLPLITGGGWSDSSGPHRFCIAKHTQSCLNTGVASFQGFRIRGTSLCNLAPSKRYPGYAIHNSCSSEFSIAGGEFCERGRKKEQLLEL